MNIITSNFGKGFSWGSVTGGVVATFSIAFLLSILGISLGLSIIDPFSDDIINGAGTTVLLWSGFSIVASLAVGSYISGYLARIHGSIHGLIVWATSIALALILVIITVASVVKTTVNAVGSLASATGTVFAGASDTLADSFDGFSNLGQDLIDQIDIDSNIESSVLKEDILQALQKSGIETFDPDFLKKQLNVAKSDISSSVKKIMSNPESFEPVIKELSENLKELSIRTTDDLDRNKIENALTSNTNLSREEVHKIADGIIIVHEKLSTLINNNFVAIQNQIETAKEKYSVFKEEAKKKAAKAAEVASQTALWGFLSLVIALIVCMVSGKFGATVSMRVESN